MHFPWSMHCFWSVRVKLIVRQMLQLRIQSIIFVPPWICYCLRYALAIDFGRILELYFLRPCSQVILGVVRQAANPSAGARLV